VPDFKRHYKVIRPGGHASFFSNVIYSTEH